MSFTSKNEIIFCDGVKQEEYSKVTFESVYLGNKIYVKTFPYSLHFCASVIIRSRPILQPLKVNLFINEKFTNTNDIPLQDLKNMEHFILALNFNIKFDSIGDFKIEIGDSKNNILCQRIMNVVSGPSPLDSDKLIYNVTDL